jgi:TDG/mug DNA glycosylase family protein
MGANREDERRLTRPVSRVRKRAAQSSAQPLAGAAAREDISSLRLRDRIKPGLKVLFVGINPGVRSAQTGHHFAGFSNRFWKLLWDARLVPEPIGYLDDDRLPEWGYGITNLVPRPTPGINDLRPAEYVDGWKALERKIGRYRPAIVALVGVTLYRAILPLLDNDEDVVREPIKALAVGPRPEAIHGARIYVLPNPSGRNANFSYAEMLEAFRGLTRTTKRLA